jgi:hypothetical protein
MAITPRLMGAEVKRKEDPRLVTGASAYVGCAARTRMRASAASTPRPPGGGRACAWS